MPEPERETIKGVSITLPRSFYNAFYRYKLYEEYSSFSDWVRDAVRESRDKWRIRRSSESLSDGPAKFT